MSRIWTWIAALLIGLLVILSALIVTANWKWLLDTAWGSVVINIISDFFFVIVLVMLFGFLYRGMLARVRDFFGIDQQPSIQIYISTHEDITTSTKMVITAEEYGVADELRNALKRQFPDFVAFWARLFGVDLVIPEIVIKGSPLEKIESWPYQGGCILIGGPTRNKLAEFFLGKGDPWLTFDDTKKKFIERRDGGKQKTELENSHRLAILEKLVINDRVVVIVFGFGEVGTVAAVRYLIQKWKVLAGKYRSKTFAHLLFVDEQGQVQLQKEYSQKSI